MKTVHTLIVLCTILASGCGGSSSSGSDEANSTNNSNMAFDVISTNDTVTGGTGHYSITYQARDRAELSPISELEQPNVSYTLYENDFELAESKIQIEKNPKTVINHIMLVLDFSGSVVGDCEGIDRYFDTSSGQFTVTNPYADDNSNLCNQLVSSATRFIDTVVTDNQKLAIFYFNSRSSIFPLVEQPTSDKKQLTEGMQVLFSKQFRELNLSGYESTNLYGAIVESTKIACQWVDQCHYDGLTTNSPENKELSRIASVVVFTDGRELAARVSEEEMMEMVNMHSDNYYYTIGLGNVDDTIMKSIGKDGFFKVEDVANLNEGFNDLGIGLEDWANSFYKLHFCPTQQTGDSEIVLKVRDNERKLFGELAVTITLPTNVDLRCDL